MKIINKIQENQIIRKKLKDFLDNSLNYLKLKIKKTYL